jgi:hypothetical protein
MQTLNSLADDLSMGKVDLEGVLPGSFVNYVDIKQKSSHVELASTGGVLKKSKERTVQKALYEFLSLELWHDLLNAYSDVNPLRFRAPKPFGIGVSDGQRTDLYMSFLNGYAMKRLCAMKRTTPVAIPGQKYPLPLYAACALHLGALNRIKEEEELYHSDYDTRHVLFSPVSKVGISVIDVENTRKEPSEDLVLGESERVLKLFESQTSSERDRASLRGWYEQGREGVILPPSERRFEAIAAEVGERHGIDFDPINMKMNGYCVRTRKS